MRTASSKLIIHSLIVIAIVGGLFILHKFLPLSFFESSQIKSFVGEYGTLAPLVYIILYVFSCFVLFPKAPLTIAGGVLFGVYFGVLYTVIGATMGATLAFTLARYWGADTIRVIERDKFKKLSEYDEKLARHGFLTVFFLRLIPLFPFTGLNFALGLSRVSFRDYFFATAIGIIPGAIAYTLLGESILFFYRTRLAFSIFLLLSFVLILVFYSIERGKK